MSYNQQFFILTADLKEKINLKQNVSPVDFTILTHSFSGETELSIDLLKQCVNAYPKEFVRNLLCLRPGRLIEHEILAQLQAGIKLDTQVDDEADTFGSAFTLVQNKIASSEIEQNCLNIYKENYKEVERFYDDMFNGVENSYSFSPKEVHDLRSFYPEISTSVREAQDLRSFYTEISTKEPCSTNQELLKSVCIQRGIALIYTNRAREIIEPLVNETIHDLCEQGKLERLEYVAKDESVAVFTTGGVASGKGTCLKNISAVLKVRQPSAIQWNQLVHHNADRLKLFLQRPELEPEKYSQYTYEEALFVKDRIMQLIAKKSNEMGHKYPHFLHDQTKLKPDELREANQRYGEVIITAISTEVSSSIQWAYGRGQSTNRYEHTEGLLGSHQAVPGEMMKSLNQQELMGSGKISVAMYDNNSPTRDLTMFASIEMKTREIVVYNDEMMQKWIKKENINPKAKPGEDLYFDKLIRTSAEYFSPLVDRGFSLQIIGNAMNSEHDDNLNKSI